MKCRKGRVHSVLLSFSSGPSTLSPCAPPPPPFLFPFIVQWAQKMFLNVYWIQEDVNFEDAEIFKLSSLNYKHSMIYTMYYEGALYKDKHGLTHTGWTNGGPKTREMAQHGGPPGKWPSRVRFVLLWTVHAAFPDVPYSLPWSGAAQLRASGKSSCCCWCYVHKTPSWALSC